MGIRLNRKQFVIRLVILYAVYLFAVFGFRSLIPENTGGIFYIPVLTAIIFGGFVLLSILNTYWTVKRLHDFNISGWWCVPTLFPIIGQIISIALIVPEGTKGENKYGA